MSYFNNLKIIYFRYFKKDFLQSFEKLRKEKTINNFLNYLLFF